jgi:hypothetical protein
MVKYSEKQIIPHIQNLTYFQVEWEFNESRNQQDLNKVVKFCASMLSLHVWTLFNKLFQNFEHLLMFTWLLGLKKLRVSWVQTSITTGMTTI